MFQSKAESFKTTQNLNLVRYTNKTEKFGVKINLISSQKKQLCLYIYFHPCFILVDELGFLGNKKPSPNFFDEG
jgi:hypothetical protein